mgnify:CR=1 FL=1
MFLRNNQFLHKLEMFELLVLLLNLQKLIEFLVEILVTLKPSYKMEVKQGLLQLLKCHVSNFHQYIV